VPTRKAVPEFADWYARVTFLTTGGRESGLAATGATYAYRLLTSPVAVANRISNGAASSRAARQPTNVRTA
jgi:hypothetical protein